jgi:hypothetical protein
MRGCGLDFPNYGGDCCEHGNEHSDITEYMELFDWLSEVLKLFKEGCAPWSQFTVRNSTTPCGCSVHVLLWRCQHPMVYTDARRPVTLCAVQMQTALFAGTTVAAVKLHNGPHYSLAANTDSAPVSRKALTACTVNTQRLLMRGEITTVYWGYNRQR